MYLFALWCVLAFQSLDPLPMQGPELGVQPDDIEAPGVAREPQQEVLDNKNVRLQSEMHKEDQHNCSYMVEVFFFFVCVCVRS